MISSCQQRSQNNLVLHRTGILYPILYVIYVYIPIYSVDFPEFSGKFKEIRPTAVPRREEKGQSERNEACPGQ